MSIAIQTEGRRAYAIGNTFPIKEQLRDMGAKWDVERHAWWVGTAKQAELQRLLEKHSGAAATPASSEPKSDGLKDSDRIAGKCQYSGKEYFLLWMGATKNGYSARVATLDGQRTFWVKISDDASHIPVRDNPVRITKTYEDREGDRRGYGRVNAMTWGKIKQLRAKYAEARKQGVEACGKCGGLHRDRTCKMCGCAKCDGAFGGLCEED